MAPLTVRGKTTYVLLPAKFPWPADMARMERTLLAAKSTKQFANQMQQRLVVHIFDELNEVYAEKPRPDVLRSLAFFFAGHFSALTTHYQNLGMGEQPKSQKDLCLGVSNKSM